jgi:hypothetical protein
MAKNTPRLVIIGSGSGGLPPLVAHLTDVMTEAAWDVKRNNDA